MKRFNRMALPAGVILLLFLMSCNTGYRTDIHALLAPASLPYLKPSKLIQVSSHDTSGGNADGLFILPGQKKDILKVEGPGMIVRIWCNVISRDPWFLRRIVIRMYWDDESKPSVEVPFGDFFGCGFSYTPFVSQYLSMTSGGYLCTFPMPFERSARIEIVNQTLQEIEGFFYNISYQKFEGALESDVSYFHASWNRSIRTAYDSNYVLLKTQGKGHIVGINMNIQSYDGSLSYLDGDEMFYVDGEKRPSIHGTGTDDFFSGGTNFNYGTFAGRNNGLIYKDDSLGRIAAYRFHIEDAIPFRKNILLTIEHGHGNQVIADYSSTVYWYQMEPHQPFPSMLVAGQRIPLRISKPVKMLEAEQLNFNMEGLRSKVMDMSDNGPDWGNHRQLLVDAWENASFSLDMNGLKEPLYNIDLYYTRGPEYGNADIYLNGMKAGTINGYSPLLLPDGKITLSGSPFKTGWAPTSGTFNFRFVVTGKNEDSKGYDIGIDGFSLEPHRVYIPDWYIIGPFPNPHRIGQPRRGIDSIYIPEVYVDLKKEYTDVKGKFIRWKYVRTPENGCVILSDIVYPREQVVAYAVTYIYSPSNKKVSLFVGSDDGCKVLFNDRVIYRYLGDRMAEPDQAEIELDVKKGWNKLLLKIENNLGQFAFYARLLDTEKNLIISADKSFSTYD